MGGADEEGLRHASARDYDVRALADCECRVRSLSSPPFLALLNFISSSSSSHSLIYHFLSSMLITTQAILSIIHLILVLLTTHCPSFAKTYDYPLLWILEVFLLLLWLISFCVLSAQIMVAQTIGTVSTPFLFGSLEEWESGKSGWIVDRWWEWR